MWLRPSVDETKRASCTRCGTSLLNPSLRSIQRTVALTLAGLILFMVAVTFPFLEVERAGLANRISVLDAITVLWLNKMHLLAVATALFIIAFPLLQLLVFFTLGVRQLRRLSLTHTHARALRFTKQIAPWSMAEIFMIGVVVSLVKIGELADIRLGPAFWAMVSLNLVLLITSVIQKRDGFWQLFRLSQ